MDNINKDIKKTTNNVEQDRNWWKDFFKSWKNKGSK